MSGVRVLLYLMCLKGASSQTLPVQTPTLPRLDPTTSPLPTPSVNGGCDLSPCLTMTGCGGFERCLLDAVSKGCNSYTIAYNAREAYRDCLFGPNGFCSLEPVAGCYDKNLLLYTKAPIPRSSRYRPDMLARFIDGIISIPVSVLPPTIFLDNPNCTIPNFAIRNMTSCVADAYATVEKECLSVMPVARNTFFGHSDLFFLQGHAGNLYRVLDTYAGNCQIVLPFFVTPTYGPISGGTNVTIIGDLTGLFTPAIGGRLCQIINRQGNSLTCISPSVTAPGMYRITINGSSASQNRNPPRYVGNFTYGGIPKIEEVNNLQTVLSGGTNVVVRGENLMSVERPLMLITARFQGDSWLFTSVCNVISNAEIKCPVPALINPREENPSNIPPVNPFPGNFNPNIGPTTTQFSRKKRSVFDEDLKEFLDLNSHQTITGENDIQKPNEGRQKRSTFEEDMNEFFDFKPHQAMKRNFINSWNVERRHKRNVCGPEKGDEEPINDDTDLTYDVSFDLDGQNVQGSRGYTIDVFPPPEVYRFEESECTVYRRWALIKDTQIDIKGENMGFPLTCEDYKITIGEGGCEVKQLYGDRIVCAPPDDEPEGTPGDSSQKLSVRVTVGAGHQQFYVGCLEYEAVIFDNDTARYGFIAGLCALVLVIFLIAIACCIHCRRKK